MTPVLPARFTLRHLVLAAAAIGVAALSTTSGCMLHDPGAAEEKTGAIAEGALCSDTRPATSATAQASLETTLPGAAVAPATATTGDCPPCSTADGAACHDRFYPSADRCNDDTQCGGGACRVGYCVRTDVDRDGIDDALEAEVAEKNFPAVFLHPDEQCGKPVGIVYRLHRHPERPSRLVVTYVLLYSLDCGMLGHVGDNESFSITVDLDGRPGADATVGVLTEAHRHTACGSTSSCETGVGTGACGQVRPDGQREVVVYSSKNKHGHYLSRGACERNCFDQCDAGWRVAGLPFVNVGEPDAATTNDLSAGEQGFITEARGWDPELLHADPWSLGLFGHAGHIRDQLLTLVAPTGK